MRRSSPGNLCRIAESRIGIGGMWAAATFLVLSLSLPVPDLDPEMGVEMLSSCEATCARERRLNRRKRILGEEEL